MAPAPPHGHQAPHRVQMPARPTRPEPATPVAQVSPGGPFWVDGGGSLAGRGLTLPSPPGKTFRETPKSRPKPKCSRYRREKQQGGEQGGGGNGGGLGGVRGSQPSPPSLLQTCHHHHCHHQARPPSPCRSGSRVGPSARSPIAQPAAVSWSPWYLGGGCHRRPPTLSPPLQMRSSPMANPPACPEGRCPAAAPRRAASRPVAPPAPAATARDAAGRRGTVVKGPAIAAARVPHFPARRRRSDEAEGETVAGLGTRGWGHGGDRGDAL